MTRLDPLNITAIPKECCGQRVASNLDERVALDRPQTRVVVPTPSLLNAMPESEYYGVYLLANSNFIPSNLLHSSRASRGAHSSP